MANRGSILLLVLLGVSIISAPGTRRVNAEVYNAVILHPTDSDSSTAFGVSLGFQVGESNNHATLWQGTAESAVDLNPEVSTWSRAWDVWNEYQVGVMGGWDHVYDAVMWSGTAESYVNLTPDGCDGSDARAIFGNYQAGHALVNNSSHALLWQGTSESAIDLHPSGFDNSEALDVYGSQQVGFGYSSGPWWENGQALLWEGTAESMVNLHPTGFDVSFSHGTSGSHQVGYGSGDITGGSNHALLWSGSAESVIDLNPSGFDGSEALKISGNYQVGIGRGSSTDGWNHALLWSGSADNFVDLHSFLPDIYTSSYAYDIDSMGNIVGLACTLDAQYHAVLWTPEPATLILFALGGLVLRKR